jgi:peptide/nickel transport system ATP-binding protein
MYPHQLSGGQRQRAMIAAALILEPKVLIADEPTTALDVTTQAQILRLIRSLQAEHGTGVLYITHDFGIVADIADRVAVMQRGRIVELGVREQVLEEPVHAYTRSLIKAIPRLKPRGSSVQRDAPIVMRASEVNKTFRTGGGWIRRSGHSIAAVKNFSLQLRLGETVGIVGESGSGKSTAARCLVRLLKADSGSITFDGTDLCALSTGAMRPYRGRVQMVFQDPYGSLNPRHRVGRIIANGPITHGLPREDAYARTTSLLEQVGLDAHAAGRFPHEFSGGQRQRIAIARALALEPKVVVADEAVSALDVSIQAQILQLLQDIKDRTNLSLVFITHDLRVAAAICDVVIVMKGGEIVEQGPTSEILFQPKHPYTKQLLASVPGQASNNS